MADIGQVREHMEVVGADGAHIGIVDKVDGSRIKLTKPDSGSHSSHHHYISGGLIAGIDGNQVRLSANADAAVLLEEEQGGQGLGEPAPLWNWRNIGIGAAAAVVAGAAFLQFRGRSED